MADRRDRMRLSLRDAGVDLLLVTDPRNVRYLSGFSGTNGQMLVGGEAASDDRLITDPRYLERAARECPDLPVTESRDAFAVALEAIDSGRLGFEASHLSWAVGQQLHTRAAANETDIVVVATTELVESMRTVKDDAEVALIARACAITTQAMDELFAEVVATGRTERQLATWLERRFVDLGAEAAAFPSIVASGPNAAIPHHAPTDRALAAGDLLTVDCGARVDGYHADCTRTVAIDHLDDELRRVYDAVARAQETGRAAAVAGAACEAVDAAAREVIAEAGYETRFVHGTGHGVGLAIHEAPAVTRGAGGTLEVGMALTVEPGVYLPGIGGVRIEDTIVVTTDGHPRVLTTSTRELRVLPTRPKGDRWFRPTTSRPG